MIKDSKVNREKVDWLLEQPVDVQVSIMQQHLDICKLVLNSLLRTNVESLAGVRYCRTKPHDGRYSRWGYNPGSVKVSNQKLPIDVPRLYDQQEEKHFNVPVYEKMKKEAVHSEEMVNSVLHGISMRDYGQVATQLIDSFGLSPATVSRQFVTQSKEAIETFFNRSLAEYRFVAMFVDGKHLSAQQMIIALGITDKGQKIPLSVIQTSTENSTVIGQMFRDLINRGLTYEHGILFVLDGSKGIHKAIGEVFGSHGIIQRCQWHKRENVISYLREDLQEHYRKQMQRAYQEPEYRLAKAQLLSLGEELKKINLSAARSL
ncbi:MAG: IS256 family transposase, partial [Acidobacteriota bacterium]